MTSPMPVPPVEGVARHGTVTSPWAEQVIIRRELLHDGVRASITRLCLATALFVGLASLPASPWWVFLAAVFPLVHGSAEILSHLDLQRSGAPRRVWVRAISATTRGAWDRGRFVNATGVWGLFTVVVLTLGVLGLVAPAQGPVWALVTVWLATVLYAMSGSRSVLSDAPFARRSPRLRARWTKVGARWGAGPALAGFFIGLLAFVQARRGPFPADALPALVLVCLLPVLMRAELSMVDRILRAADEEHALVSAELRRSVAETARDTVAPVAASARYALRDMDAPTARSASEALQNLPLLVEALAANPGRARVDGLPVEAVERALSVATAEYAGLVDLDITAHRLTTDELDTCLRIVRQVLASLDPDAAGHWASVTLRLHSERTLLLDLTSTDAAGLTGAVAAVGDLLSLVQGHVEILDADAGAVTVHMELPLPRWRHDPAS